MDNKSLLATIAGVCSCLASTATQAQKIPKKAVKPNVIIIYTDDMGVGDLSCLNNGWIKTPNIDKLAQQGLIIKNYYTAAPVSSPSRAGLTTGRFPLQLGINTFLSSRAANKECEQFDFLDPNVPTMGKIFKQAGYSTGHFGKWHLGGGRDVDNAPKLSMYGFDEYSSTWESPEPDPAVTGDSTWIWSNKDLVKRWDRTAYFADRALDFLVRHKDTPCFINLWPDDVHTPWVPDQESSDSNKGWQSKPNFEAVMTHYDTQIGYFLDRLDAMGLTQNTIVIFSSDNGPAPSFQQVRTNGLRGTKNSLYEGGIRMPFIVRWPAKIEAGKIDSTSIVCALDLLPSLCAIIGATLPEGSDFSGEDMSRSILGERVVQRKKDLMWDFGRNSYFGKPTGENNASPHLAIRRGEWKLLMNSDATKVELYNMKNDERETQNVASNNPKIVEQLSRELILWWDTRKIRLN